MTLSILIAGDLVPTDSNRELFENADLTELLGNELYSIWDSADIRIFNLEVPISNELNPIKKAGPNLCAPTSIINGIKELKPSLLTLANNHILDQGLKGFNDTINILEKHEVQYTGVGSNINEASKPYIFEVNGMKIGVYACAEHEFSIATRNNAGANPFDPLNSLDHIHDLKAECDHVIILYHGGKEYYRYPTPDLQKRCRRMADKGADTIICQHTHCIGAVEEYNNSTIIYGQGNFIFDYFDNEYWNTSLIVKLTIDESIKIDYLPIIKNKNKVRIANEIEKEEILKSFQTRSNEIKNDEFVHENFINHANKLFLNYLSGLHGENILFRLINKISNRRFIKKIYSVKSLLWIRNMIECEAHREFLLASLKE